MKKVLLISFILHSSLCISSLCAQSVQMPLLIDSVHNIIQPIKVLSYGGGDNRTWGGFRRVDMLDGNAVRDRYSNTVRYFNTDNSAVSGMNIEHIWANSWWGHIQNNAYKDLFNLFPADGTANGKKSNNPIGVVNGTIAYQNGVVKIGKSGSYRADSLITVWEPADEWKGDFARTYFYMATCYKHFGKDSLDIWTTTEGLLTVDPTSNLVMCPWVYNLMLEWARQDPVDQIERDRCDSIEWIQGNRNPFVDEPNLCEYIWGDSTDLSFDLKRIRSKYHPEIHIEPAPDPSSQAVLSVSPLDMTFVTSVGNPSAGQKTTVFMKNVDTPKCTVQSEEPFEVSLDSVNWSTKVTTSYATQGFYVRFAGTHVFGDYEGDIACSAPGADDRIITAVCHVSEYSFWENFETGSKSSYAAADAVCSAATWNMSNAMLASDAEKDKPRDSRCVRMKGYVKSGQTITTPAHIMMVTDKENGCDSLSFWACSYGTDTGVKIMVSYSLDGGVNWSPVVSSLSLTSAMKQYKYSISQKGKIRLKFESLNNSGSKRACIDDVMMTDYKEGTGIEGPLSPTLSPKEGKGVDTYDCSGRRTTGGTKGVIIYNHNKIIR